VLALALTLGCNARHAPAPAPASDSHNVEACEKYVQKLNDLPCNAVELDPSQQCPPSLNQNPCDTSAYYRCMAEGVTCTGENGFLDVAGQAACAPNCN